MAHSKASAYATALEARLTRGAGGSAARLPPPLFTALNLTAEQRQKLLAFVDPAFQAREARDATSAAKDRPSTPYTRQTVLGALREDVLDVDRVAPHHDSAQLAMLDPAFFRPLAESILAILTPAQRKTASDWLRANASQLEAGFR